MSRARKLPPPQSLQEWMERKGVNTTQLARLANMTQPALSNILTGSRMCGLARAIALHKITGVPVEKLVQWPKIHPVRSFIDSTNDETGHA